MSDFFKYMLATICGIVVLTIIGILLLTFSFVGIMASGETKVRAMDNSVFVLQLSGIVEERTEDNPLSMLLNEAEMQQMGLDDILSAIEKARNEENIKGIYIEGGNVTFDSPATAQQIHDALLDFRKSGKWVYAYADQLMQASYYVCSAADSLFLNATGMIDFKGLGGKHEYMTGLYEKIGVRYMTARVGKYKSYVESVTRKDMSDEDREQREAYLKGIWNKWTEQMARNRKVTAQQLDQLANDSIMLFATTDDYQQAHLVDRVFYPEQMKQVMYRKLGVDPDEPICQLTLDDMKNLRPEKKIKKKGDEIAVYYAYGEIVDEMMDPFYMGHNIVGKETTKDLLKLADDDNVKAVVLRVNSGGGSAIASEQIWHATQLLKQKKPVVVSMGGAAASGGYMISCGANYIVAEPTTITGSIGIFGLIPNFNELVTDKLGITWDGVSTNKYTDYETNLIFSKENSEELHYMQGYVDRGYERFINIVAKGRGMTKEQVNEIAQGRVWLAPDAQGIKLVDKLGSLNDAIAKAAELAGLTEYHTNSYPIKTDWIEQLLSGEQRLPSYLDAKLKMMLGNLYEPVLEMRLDQMRNRLQARLPYTITIQ
ncbi:MAG: signal peptide peptidase SppA [Prevotella sp.]|nr:signal peptide peptidase SppA [Prevotella sp.]